MPQKRYAWIKQRSALADSGQEGIDDLCVLRCASERGQAISDQIESRPFRITGK
jgi:hypothetical protein